MCECRENKANDCLVGGWEWSILSARLHSYLVSGIVDGPDWFKSRLCGSWSIPDRSFCWVHRTPPPSYLRMWMSVQNFCYLHSTGVSHVITGWVRPLIQVQLSGVDEVTIANHLFTLGHLEGEWPLAQESSLCPLPHTVKWHSWFGGILLL